MTAGRNLAEEDWPDDSLVAPEPPEAPQAAPADPASAWRLAAVGLTVVAAVLVARRLRR